MFYPFLCVECFTNVNLHIVDYNIDSFFNKTRSYLSGNFTRMFNDVDATKQLRDLGYETLCVLQG